MMSDDEILEFYVKLKSVLGEKPYRILYLDVEDILSTIHIIRKERTDDRGNEMWFPLMIRYIEQSPYGKLHGFVGEKGLIEHLEKRQELEHRMIAEVFRENAVQIKAKNYDWKDIMKRI